MRVRERVFVCVNGSVWLAPRAVRASSRATGVVVVHAPVRRSDARPPARTDGETIDALFPSVLSPACREPLHEPTHARTHARTVMSQFAAHETPAADMLGSEQLRKEQSVHGQGGAAQNPKFRCRFYEQEFPKEEDVVVVQVNEIKSMGAYVSLLEYDNIEGMVLLSELSRRRIRSINKIIRVGKTECVSVLRVDKERGYIDLSKRRAGIEEVQQCNERYNKSKAVHSIMRHVAEHLDVPLKELNEKIAWPLYRKKGHAYDAFKLAITSQEVFDGIDMGDDVRKILMENIQRRLTPQPIKIRADIEVTCFKYEGVDAVRAALREVFKFGTTDLPFEVNLIAPPLYVVRSQAIDKEQGIELSKSAIEAVKAEIEKRGGSLVVKMEPRATTNKDEEKLEELMEQMELENAEFDGDDD